MRAVDAFVAGVGVFGAAWCLLMMFLGILPTLMVFAFMWNVIFAGINAANAYCDD